jgi:hypothetical protein
MVKRAKRIGIILPSRMNTDGYSNNKAPFAFNQNRNRP